MAESAGHETIIHTLDKWRNYEGRQCYYGVDNFMGTEPAWDSAPLIFAQSHPNLKLVKNNLDDALSKVKDYKGRPGKVVGRLVNSKVTIAGQPRLAAETVFDDPEVQDLYNQGKLSLSSGFVCNEGNDGRLDGKVEPNHVLVFVQDRDNQGREPGAMFLNKEDSDVTNEFKNSGKVISAPNKMRFKTAIDSLMSLFHTMTKDEETNGDQMTNKEVEMDEAMKIENETLKTEKVNLETKVAGLEKELGDLKTSQEKLNKEISDAREAATKVAAEKADQEWANLKKTYIPPGMVKSAEDEKALRELATASPMEFHNKVAAIRVGNKKQADGREFSNKDGESHEEKMNRVLSQKIAIPGTLHK